MKLLQKGLVARTLWLKKSFDPILMALSNPSSGFETKNSNSTSFVLSRWVNERTDVSAEKSEREHLLTWVVKSSDDHAENNFVKR